jgi:hypothetical protein
MTHSPPHGTTPTPANLFQNPLPERPNLKERCHTLRWLHNRRTVDFPFRFKSLQIFSSYVLTAVAFESERKSTAATCFQRGNRMTQMSKGTATIDYLQMSKPGHEPDQQQKPIPQGPSGEHYI